MRVRPMGNHDVENNVRPGQFGGRPNHLKLSQASLHQPRPAQISSNRLKLANLSPDYPTLPYLAQVKPSESMKPSEFRCRQN